MEYYVDGTDSEGMSAERSEGFSPWGLERKFKRSDVLLPTWMLPDRRPAEVLENQLQKSSNSAEDISNSTVHLTQTCTYVINSDDFKDNASSSATKRPPSPPLSSTDSKRLQRCQSTPSFTGVLEVKKITE
ncbi:hypothetical protein M758_UG101700 [Ceratodon purpureus]|nr:hypothetical protein M758_UG101700 [Ceratodon purpureus]